MLATARPGTRGTPDASGVPRVAPDLEAALTWFRLLYGDDPDPDAGYLNIWTDAGRTSHWFPVDDLAGAARTACALAARGQNAYYGVGLRARAAVDRLPAARRSGVRGGSDAVSALPALWADVDIAGPAHKETALPPTLRDALALVDTTFPPPLRPSAYVLSPHGVHAYWLLADQPWRLETEAERRRAASLLRRLQRSLREAAARRRWKVDATADLARVLRPPGTLNVKPGLPAAPVCVLEARGNGLRFNPHDFLDWDGLADDPETETAAEAHTLAGDFRAAHYPAIRDGCAFVAHCEDDAAALPEPQWYAQLGIVGRCEDGVALAHRLSRPDPRYTAAATTRKLAHALEHGPATCATVGDRLGFAGCRACPHAGQITSPIVLGRPPDPEFVTDAPPNDGTEEDADGAFTRTDAKIKDGSAGSGINSFASHGGADRDADVLPQAPPLPAFAVATAEATRAAEPARALLDAYCDDAVRMAPRSPRALHELFGIGAQMTAIARRVYLQAGPKRVYPSLFGVFVGRSTLTAKTTAEDVLKLAFEAAGLEFLLFPGRFTAEALLARMGLSVPQDVREGGAELQARWQERLRHAPQGLILRDEVHGLLEDCNRDYNAGLLPLLLEMEGAPARLEDGLTISRGHVEVRNVCVSLLGATTPAGLRQHAAKAYHWHNGLFGRFALVDEPRLTYAFWDQAATSTSATVVEGLRAIYAAFPRPQVAFDLLPGDDKTGARIVGAHQDGYSGGTQATITADAWQAYAAYDRALWGLLRELHLGERLDPTYGRLPVLALRVALTLATAQWATGHGTEGPHPVVGLAHWTAAQAIAERWRASAHRILGAACRSAAEEHRTELADRVCRLVQSRGGKCRRGDVLRLAHLSTGELDEAVCASQGRLEAVVEPTGQRGKPPEWITLHPRVVANEGAGAKRMNKIHQEKTGADYLRTAANKTEDPALVATGVQPVPTDPTRPQEVLDAGVSEAAALDPAPAGERVVRVPEVGRPSNGHPPAAAAVAVLERPDTDDDAEYF